MLKARGSQQQMILFPMEMGFGCRITEITNLTYLILLFDIFSIKFFTPNLSVTTSQGF
jgi:hypothetical protein